MRIRVRNPFRPVTRAVNSVTRTVTKPFNDAVISALRPIASGLKSVGIDTKSVSQGIGSVGRDLDNAIKRESRGAWQMVTDPFGGKAAAKAAAAAELDAAAKAANEEALRQSKIRSASDAINNIFNMSGRDQLYGDHRSAIFNLNKSELDRQREEAARENRFGLARSGLLGGSVDAESNAEINRRANEGLLKVGSIADQAASDLRMQDEKTRSNLISMAQTGIDTGTAASQALNGLRVNADQAAAQRGSATIGALFNDLGQAYLARKQFDALNPTNNPYIRNQFFGSQDGRAGGHQGNIQRGY